MPKGLVLNPGYKLEISEINDSDEIHDTLGGHFELIGFVTLKKHKKDPYFNIVAYADEDGLAKNLVANEWTIFLKKFRFELTDMVVGPIILFNSNEYGEDEDISLQFIEEAKKFKEFVQSKKKKNGKKKKTK